MSKIPTAATNPAGLHRRYIVAKVSGEPVDPRAEYFVLRLDRHGSDPRHIRACRKAILIYADYIKPFLPELSADIYQRYNRSVLRPNKRRPLI